MNKEEVTHLAKLARIELTEEEIATFTDEISSVLDYVGQIKDIVGDEASSEKKVGAVHNVFRKDEVTNEPDQFTDAILAEMPETDGRFMVVKKILNTEG